ncbi:FAD binding domain-containing protein [Roseomonas sp. NAR14]|uniref:FAD binding domain-containing protein n=1 Tax=Roseomonas acroporae TaxID=2937791 RepID=A0A9X2BTD5_9PROT|nr:FAD binding domain-containing protein [Roseomonas acroporae]MCK8784498.1 FAD binding domain-containing protein [Roseomonas acroporae]
MKPPAFDYARPATLPEAFAALLGTEGAMALGGGQSLLPMLGLRVAAPSLLVDLARLPGLREVTETAARIRIGAGVTHAAIEDGVVADPSRGMLRRVAAGIAYRAVRNFGTIGGAVALADPAADWPACLLALDAVAIIAGPDGERRLPLEALLLGAYTTALEAGEILLGFDVPRLGAASRWGWCKLARKQGAYADSIGAVVLPGDGAPPRIVLGATTSRPALLPHAAAALARGEAGATLRDALLGDIEAAEPDADSYRRRCHLATVQRAIAQATSA